MKISIVTPAYRCSKCIEELYNRLVISLGKIADDFEIIFVNDSSPENDWEIISSIAQKDSRVKGINLSRNFGQHNALTAGLDFTTGDWVVVMDCDLQDQPEEIVKLFNKTKEGYDVVFGRRYERKDNFLKKMSSTLFYKVFDYFTESKFDNTIANFSISKKNVIENFRRLREKNRAFPLFILWMGFKVGYQDVEHAERKKGKSSYNIKKLINLAINSIVSQSNKPLKISIFFGFVISFFSLLIGSFLLFRHFILRIHVEGWTSVMLSIWFLGGLVFANMGLMGLYIGKVFDEAKDRPIYIIKDRIGL